MKSSSTNSTPGRTVIFASMMLNAAQVAAGHVKKLAAYMKEVNTRSPDIPTRFQVYFYAYDSLDNTVSVLADTISDLKHQGIEFDHSDVITELFCIPQTTDLMMKEWAWPKKDWPGADNSPCPLTGVKTCKRAYFRERFRQYILEQLATTAPVQDLSQSAFVYFDGVHQLPSSDSVFNAIEKVTASQAHAAGEQTRRIGAIFSNGRAHDGPAQGFYYDSFASVDRNGIFEVPSHQNPIPRGIKWVSQRSGFGGFSVYNGLAYFNPVCSYSQHKNSGSITDYIKTDVYAVEDGVAGFPCEHTNLHLCIHHSGYQNFIYSDMKVQRTTWEWHKQHYIKNTTGKVAEYLRWSNQFTNGRNYLREFIMQVDGKGGALIPNNILFTHTFNPLSLGKNQFTNEQKILRQTMLQTISTLPGHRVLFYSTRDCEKALLRFDAMFEGPHKLPERTGYRLAEYFKREAAVRNQKQGKDAVYATLKSDTCSLIQLFEHGGLYFNVDVLPVVNLRKHIRSDATLVTIRSTSELQDNDGLFHGFLAAAPRHPAIGLALLKTLEYYDARAAKNYRKMEELTLWAKHANIGGNILARAVCEFANVPNDKMQNCLHVGAFAGYENEIRRDAGSGLQDPGWSGDVWLHTLPGGYNEAIAKRFNNGTLNCTIGETVCQHNTQVFLESSKANIDREKSITWGHDNEDIIVGRQGYLGSEKMVPPCSYVAVDRHYDSILLHSHTFSADWSQFCLAAWAILPPNSLPVLKGSAIPKIIHIVGGWTKFTYEWWSAVNPGFAVQRWTPPETRFFTGTQQNTQGGSLLEYLPDCEPEVLQSLTDDDVMRIFSMAVMHKYGGVLTHPVGDLRGSIPIFDASTFQSSSDSNSPLHPAVNGTMVLTKRRKPGPKTEEFLKLRCADCPDLPDHVYSVDAWASSGTWPDGAFCLVEQGNPSMNFVAIAAPARHPVFENAARALTKSSCAALSSTALQQMSELISVACGQAQ